MKLLSLGLALLTLGAAGFGASPDTRLYELRTYYAAPGKLDDLNARFRNHTLKLFEKHGIVNIGYWTPVENPERKLVYLISFPSLEARNASFSAFGKDPAWQAVVKESEANGRLVTKVDSLFLKATDFSPAIEAAKGSEDRCFELRTYKASEGNLPNLLARFRDHTVSLFAKHGMTSFGYWTPLEAKQGAENTLVYILAHKDRAAAAASFAAFRADPAWQEAKKASEAKGSLTTKVESLFLAPTDYSPTR